MPSQTLFSRVHFNFRSTNDKAKEEYDNEAGSYDELDISRMYGIEDYDDGITRHKIGKDENVYFIFTPIEKESHIIGSIEVGKAENVEGKSPEYMEPIEGSGDGRNFDAVVSEFAGLFAKTASPIQKT